MANETEDLKKQLAAALAGLESQKLEMARLAGMVEGLTKAGAGQAVLTNAADAAEAAKAAARHQKLHDMRAKAMEIAGPGAKYVKYVVGPSGTVRPGLGVVKPGKVISVPVSELPAGEWKVFDPAAVVEDVPGPKQPENARDLQARNVPSAADKAIAQREALKAQRASDREV